MAMTGGPDAEAEADRNIPAPILFQPQVIDEVADPMQYRPSISHEGIWTLSETDLGMFMQAW